MIHYRQESELIPEGISITETEIAVYLRRKIGDHVWTIRVPVNDDPPSVTEDIRVPFDKDKWFGVWGTNG